MAHTPGPWEAQNTAGHDIHGQTAVYGAASGEDVAIVFKGAANANLIAAAPVLLAALKAYQKCGEDSTIDPKLFRAAHDQAAAAIKLATEGE